MPHISEYNEKHEEIGPLKVCAGYSSAHKTEIGLHCETEKVVFGQKST